MSPWQDLIHVCQGGRVPGWEVVLGCLLRSFRRSMSPIVCIQWVTSWDVLLGLPISTPTYPG
jgi:hypothetical protein